MTIPANAKNKTPPGVEPEGVRVASGDRGDRSPRENRSMSENHRGMPSIAHARQRIAVISRRQTELGDVIKHGKPSNKFANAGEGREHYVSFIFNASIF